MRSGCPEVDGLLLTAAISRMNTAGGPGSSQTLTTPTSYGVTNFQLHGLNAMQPIHLMMAQAYTFWRRAAGEVPGAAQTISADHSLVIAEQALHQHKMQQHTLPLQALNAQLRVRKSKSATTTLGLPVSLTMMCRYSLWRMGEHRIITRAWAHAALQVTPGGPHSATAVMQTKMEYHGNRATDAEEVTAEGACTMVVCRAHPAGRACAGVPAAPRVPAAQETAHL